MASSLGVGPNLVGGTVTYDVYVANLPAESTQRDLYLLFKDYGDVHSVLLKDSNRDENSKIAYVRFTEEELANKAATSMMNFMHAGRKLFVKRTEPKKRPQTKPVDNQNIQNVWQRQSPGQKNNMFGKEPDIVPQGGSNISPDKLKQPRSDFLQEKILVTFVESPITFYGQICNEKSEELVTISETLVSICSCAARLTGKPTFNKVYAAQFSEDMAWYRCKPIEHKSETETKIQYIDYGNCEVVKNNTIVELPANLTNITPFSNMYCLKGYLPVCPDPNTQDFIRGSDLLKTTIENQVVNAKIYSPRSGAGTPQVDLELNNVDVGQSMLMARHVVKHFSTQTDHSKIHNMQIKKFPQNQRDKCLDGSGEVKGQMFMQSMSNKITDTASQVLTPGVDVFKLKGPRKITSSENILNDKGMAPQSKLMNSGGVSSGEVDAMRAENAYLRKELENAHKQLQGLRGAKQECENVRNDRDLVIQQLNASKAQLNSLQKDFETVCQRLKDCNLSDKLQGLLIRVEKVKELRSQFPTDTKCKDNVDEAVKLVTNCASKVALKTVTSIPAVQAAHESYRACQEHIQGSTDKNCMEDLIKARDEARLTLDKNMDEFLSEVEKLPLQNRLDELKEAKSELETTHGRIMYAYSTEGVLPLTDALSIYKDWQEQRYLEFSDVRTSTNTLHNGVNNILRTLQQNLSLEGSARIENKGTCCKLDSMLNRFDQAVRDEIDKTDVENMGDARTVALVLLAVMDEMKQEESDIERLLKMKDENQEQKKSISTWLHDKPDISQIKNVRKTIRSLKSKLRHLLADIEDIKEEVEDADEAQLQTVRAELTDIRHQLHAAFQEEDRLLDELAQLNDNHFPELCQQYPDLGIENHAEFHGLVKQGRDLDQMCIEEMPGVDKKSVQKTRFLDHDVVLKEYIVDEGLGLKRKDFLKRALNYKAVSSPYILPLEAIFFLKNDRQACVQMPFYNKKLRTLVEENQLSDQLDKMALILGGVLHGLHALHEAKLIHGHIHPDNVYVDEQGRGVLAEYDFTKSLAQRASKVYSVSSGLKFMPPEVKTTKGEVTRASDMYNFGLLMLWMHFPHVHFSETDGFPDFSGLGLPQNVLDVVHNLLTPDPAMRLTTEQLLQLNYFSIKDTTDTLQLRQRQPSPDAVQTSQQTASNGRPGILKNTSQQSVPIETADDTPETIYTMPESEQITSPESVQGDLEKTSPAEENIANHDNACKDESEVTPLEAPSSEQSVSSGLALDVELCGTKPDILGTVGTETTKITEEEVKIDEESASENVAPSQDEADEDAGQDEDAAQPDTAPAAAAENGDHRNGNAVDEEDAEDAEFVLAVSDQKSEIKAAEEDVASVTTNTSQMKGLAAGDGEPHHKSRFTTASLLSARLGCGLGRGLSLSATIADMEKNEPRPGAVEAEQTE